jgi:hypothetical protein
MTHDSIVVWQLLENVVGTIGQLDIVPTPPDPRRAISCLMFGAWPFLYELISTEVIVSI